MFSMLQNKHSSQNCEGCSIFIFSREDNFLAKGDRVFHDKKKHRFQKKPKGGLAAGKQYQEGKQKQSCIGVTPV